MSNYMKIIKRPFSCLAVVIFLAGPALAKTENIDTNNGVPISVAFTGKFDQNPADPESKSNSDNGAFWCKYEIGLVSDETRELKHFELYENDQLLYSLDTAPGSDLYISNSGIIAFMDHTHHYRGELVIHFYARTGQYLFSEKFKGADLFGFSAQGNKFGVGSVKGFQVISVPDHHIETYDRGFQFNISEAENTVAVAMENGIKVYTNGLLVKEFQTDFDYTRKVRISSKLNLIAAISKRHLKVFSLTTGDLLFADSLTGKQSYRDLRFNDERLFAGIQSRVKEYSKGILRIYSSSGDIILEIEESSRYIRAEVRSPIPDGTILDYDPIPWPFAPFDSVCTVWNHYEQHMGVTGEGWSYLHQGLDLITPIAEPTYTVQPGIVKCVLTMGGDYYWRAAISPSQSSGYSNGWLYAHLIESSIAIDVGDTVEIYDYLGGHYRLDRRLGTYSFCRNTRHRTCLAIFRQRMGN